jgi:TatA/E family protein of Tat protein translocase
MLAEIASTDVVLIVVVVAILIFGSAKIPKIARGLGSAKSEFEKGLKEGNTSSDGSTDKPADHSSDKPS